MVAFLGFWLNSTCSFGSTVLYEIVFWKTVFELNHTWFYNRSGFFSRIVKKYYHVFDVSKPSYDENLNINRFGQQHDMKEYIKMKLLFFLSFYIKNF